MPTPASTVSSPPRVVDVHVVLVRFAAADGDLGGQAGDEDVAGGVVADVDVVGSVGAVDDDRVRRAVAGAAAGRAAEVDVGVLDAGARQITDGDRVGAAERGDVEVLDPVEIHRDVGDVAEQAHAGAVGRDVDVLGGV